MSRKCLVVGGTAGIGRGIAEYMASQGHSVTIAGRSKTMGDHIVKELTALTPEGATDVKHCFLPVDGFSLDSVKQLADSQKEAGVDYLVLSQGMATIQGLTPTDDGIDQKLQLHVYSRVLLAQLLAPTLVKGGDGRVLSVLSAGVHAAYANTDTDPLLQQNYSIKNAADAAGTYNDLFCDILSKEHSEVNFTHAAPGFVNTNWGTEMPLPIRWLVRGLQVFGKSYQKCGEDLGSSWLALPASGFHLMGPNGDKANRMPSHKAMMANEGTAAKWWADVQMRLQKWLK